MAPNRYCNSCGEPLESTPLGWVTAVRDHADTIGAPPFPDRPVALHVECLDRLSAVGINYSTEVTNPGSRPSPP